MYFHLLVLGYMFVSNNLMHLNLHYFFFSKEDCGLDQWVMNLNQQSLHKSKDLWCVYM